MRLKIFAKQICKRLNPKPEDLTYEDFIRIESKNYRGKKAEARPTPIHFWRHNL